MAGVSLPGDIMTLIRSLRRDVDALRKASPLRNASITGGNGLVIRGLGRLLIGAGSLLIQDEGERRVMYAGGFEGAGYGVAMWRRDNSPAFYLHGPTGQNQTLKLYDAAGMPLLEEDPTGDGLSRPFLPIPFYSADYMTWPSTDASTFSTLATATGYRQNRMVFATVRHTSDMSGTTGELRLLVNGTQVGAVVPVGFGIGEALFGPFAIPGAAGSTFQMSIQAHRTAGIGRIRAAASGAGGTVS